MATSMLLRSLWKREFHSSSLAAVRTVVGNTKTSSSGISPLMRSSVGLRWFSSRPIAEDVIGIDLGTTNSCVALMDEVGKEQNHFLFSKDTLYSCNTFHGIAMSGEKKEGNGALNRSTLMSPYFLSTNDNPGTIITQVQLKGDNYDEWARAIRTALRARIKYGFIDGTMQQPSENSSELEDWWTVNSMIVSWMLNTIEPTLRSTITYLEIAKDLWDDIKERFFVGNGPRIHQLKTELVECKQQGTTVMNYYGKLKMIWEELGNYEQNPVCKCKGCKCNISGELDKKREEERLHQFLMGLDSIYGTVRSNILSTEPLPNLNRAYAIIVQEERLRQITHGKEQRSEHMAFALQTRSTSKGRFEKRDKSIVCINCNKSGHKVKSYFQLIGYPEWWGDRPKGSGRGRGRGRGQGGSKQFATAGGRGRWGPIQANAAVITPQDSQTIEVEKGGLSGEKWNTLLNLLNGQKEGNQGRLNGPQFEDVDWYW